MCDYVTSDLLYREIKIMQKDPKITEEEQRAELAALEDIAGSLRLIARALCALADVPHFQRDDEIQHKAPGGRK